MQGKGNGQEQAAAHRHFQAEGEGRRTCAWGDAATTPSTRRDKPSRAPCFHEFSVTRAGAQACACRGGHAGPCCQAKSSLAVRSPIASIVALRGAMQRDAHA
ncbi:hypothetical protein XcvCFBP7113P_21430 [Xanthomonas citri pv. vignicola]|nr:hypothetical protein XcvCFBP7113P_21430 [Xanthomonas citri pv. vignicola]